jgi:hypothetical protein
MAGKGGKGLIAAKIAAGMDKEKKAPITRSARAGLQVAPFSPLACSCSAGRSAWSLALACSCSAGRSVSSLAR